MQRIMTLSISALNCLGLLLSMCGHPLKKMFVKFVNPPPRSDILNVYIMAYNFREKDCPLKLKKIQGGSWTHAVFRLIRAYGNFLGNLDDDAIS